MLHFHWICLKAQHATRTTESSSGKGKNGSRARWSTLVGEWNTSVLCVAPMRKDSAYTVLGYLSWVHKVSWGHPERGKMTHGLLLLRDLRGEREAESFHTQNPIQGLVLLKWLLMASNLEMIKLRSKGQKESYITCLLQGPSHAWERIRGVSKPQGLLLLQCYPSSHAETFNDFPSFLTFLNEQNTSSQQITSQHYPSFQTDIRQREKCLNCSILSHWAYALLPLES